MGELELFLRLLASAAVLGGVGLVVRRWSRRTSHAAGAGIRVVSRTGVTRGAMVAVVDLEDRRFLVGASEQGVSLLAELDTPTTQRVSAPATDRDELAATERAADLPSDLTMRDLAHGSSEDNDRPRTGLADRLRRMTVRSYVDRPVVGNHARRP